MPTYDYVCANCGLEVEVVHSIHGHGPSACSSCGGPMKKAIVASAVHFKGSGWARKERSGSAKSSRASSEPASSSSSGAEPQPTAATESKADSAAKDAD
jgi:putative FmdB family regulatory protein